MCAKNTKNSKPVIKKADFKETEVFLRILTDVNQVLIRAKTEITLLHNVCDVIVSSNLYRYVGINFMENDKLCRAAFSAASSVKHACFKVIVLEDKIYQAYFDKVLKTKKTIILSNILSKSNPQFLKNQAKKCCFNSILFLPILSKHSIIGILSIASEKKRMSSQEIKLLTELAGDLSYGILSCRRRKELVRAKKNLENMLLQTVKTVALTLEKRDPYTAGHQQRVAHLSRTIALKMGLSQAVIQLIHVGALIHDVGKIYIPSEILSRPGVLIMEEFLLLKTHPEIGREIVKNIPFNSMIPFNIVLQHHERLDGSGYPGKLIGDDIPMESRIVAVADVVEAMTSHRPYRPKLSIHKALSELTKNSGKQYDAEVVNACMELYTRNNFQFPVENS